MKEINTSPQESGWNQEIFAMILLYLTINQSENCAQVDHIPWGVRTSGRSLSQLEGAAGRWVVIVPCGTPDKPLREVGGLPPPQPPWETPQGVNLRNSGDKLHSL